MRLEDAIYTDEIRAQHYFRDFAYCDSGMTPWLLASESAPLANHYPSLSWLCA